MRCATAFTVLLATFGIGNAALVHGKPPEGFTPLFNGKDLTGWKGLVGEPKTRAEMTPAELAAAQRTADEKMRSHWTVSNGELCFDGKGENLCTVKKYGDFELYVDWKIDRGGDSGIYLRGTPQVQIWDTSFEPYFSNGSQKGSGGIWNNQKHPRFPLVHADKPLGEWNAFRIRMQGQKVSVWLNGQLVVDNVTFENTWEPDKPIYESDSIELQSHETPLRFRNIYVKEL